jgi:NADPH:quinone reductase-like Zn-dependent oxidoreductase
MDSRFSLADASRAHQRMEEGHHIGKIVLEVMADEDTQDGVSG